MNTADFRSFGRSSFPLSSVVLIGLLLSVGPVWSGTAGSWVSQGPAPNTDGQVENLLPGDEVTGAINAVVAHPSNADILYVGSVNGGVWKTTNATSVAPSWAPLTDDFTSLSIGALDLDPLDVTNETLVAGVGRFSSFLRTGGPRIGVLRSADGGANWSLLNGAGTLTGKNISGIAVRGQTIVVSVNAADTDNNSNRGVFRSVDGGATFVQMSVGNGTLTGLPDGLSFDIGRSRQAPATLFAPITSTSSGVNGIYRSLDTGATWTKVSDAAMDAQLVPTVSNVEIAINANGIVYVAIARSGTASGVFRSADGGSSWTAMDVPSTNPGSQGSIHFSLVADPTNDNLVYIGGDIQTNGAFGSTDFTGRLFRGNAAAALGSQWVHLTHRNDVAPAGGGTASASAPHGDSREMVFDAAGNIVEVDDGGIAKRTSPQDNTGDWFSLNGDLQVTEAHSMAWDSNADVLLTGAQDTGTPAQTSTGNRQWFSVSTADGGDVAIDDTSTPGLAARYSSFQNLGAFRRQVRDTSNTLISQTFPPRTVVGGGAAFAAQFVTPLGSSGADADRLILGGNNSVYESLDGGTTIREIGPGIRINSLGADAIAYGIAANPDLLWVGSAARVFVRTAAFPATLQQSLTYSGGSPVAIVADPDQANQAFVIDSANVYRTNDTGASWTNVTGNLGTFAAGTFGALEYLNGPSGDAIAVGTNRGVYFARESSNYSEWELLGTGLPNVRIFELDFDATANLLLVGTFGRGTFSLENALIPGPMFADGFESGTTGGWSLAVP